LDTNFDAFPRYRPVSFFSGGNVSDMTSHPFTIIANGRVIDAANGRDDVADIAIAGGKIVAVEQRLAGRIAEAKIIDVSDRVVTPGLIDLHTHVFDGLGDFCLPADRVGVESGVTTVIDAGTAGAAIFNLARRAVIDHPATRTRVLALLDPNQIYLATKHFICHYLEIANDERNLDLKDAARVLRDNADVVVGMKVRATCTADPHSSPFLEGAKSIAGDLPIMVHMGEFPHTPVITTDDLLSSLRAGDIVTHCFRASSGVLDRDLQPTAIFRDALERGVKLDIGHSGGDFHFGTARHLIGLGILPNTISTDLNVFNVDQPVRSLALTMSKIWALGVPLADVIAMATINPARVIHRDGELGSLAPGRCADISLLRIVAGRQVMSDGYETHVAERWLEADGCWRAGEWIAARRVAGDQAA
jgi:dihydroorotase